MKKILGNKAAFSAIVTLEPRRRKFHKPITMTIPIPKSSNTEGPTSEFSGETPTLRLLCSITGNHHTIQIGRISEQMDSYVKDPVILFQEEPLLPSGRTSPALHRSHLSTNVFPSPQMYRQGISFSSTTRPSFPHNYEVC